MGVINKIVIDPSRESQHVNLPKGTEILDVINERKSPDITITVLYPDIDEQEEDEYLLEPREIMIVKLYSNLKTKKKVRYINNIWLMDIEYLVFEVE